jgi:hypothetical protein
MDSALIVTWRTPIPGREKAALDYAVEVNEYWGKLAADGKCSEPEMFFLSDYGMWMVKGTTDTLWQLYGAEASQRLLRKGQLLLDHFTYELVKTGDAAAGFMLQFADLAKELSLL